MLKKTLLSLAVAATTLTIAGCNLSTTDEHENKIRNEGVVSAQPSSVYPLFNPQPTDGSAPQLPLATDIIFSINNQADGTPGKDGTAQTVDNQAPVTTAVNKLAGFSTVAPLYINFSEELNSSTVVAGKTVILAKLATGDTPLETATNPAPTAVSTDVYEASYIELDDASGNAIPAVRILFKQPLQPKSKYLVIFTDGIKGKNGEKAGSAATYGILASTDTINNITAQQQALRTTIQNWQKLANGVLGGKGKSVFSYTFTTDGSLDGLMAYAAPALAASQLMDFAVIEAMVNEAGLPLPKYAARAYYAARNSIADLTSVSEAVADDVLNSTDAFSIADYRAFTTNIALGANGLNINAASLSPVHLATKAKTAVQYEVPDADVTTAIKAINSAAPGAAPAVIAGLATGSGLYLHSSFAADYVTRYKQGTIRLPSFLEQASLTNLTDVDMGLVATGNVAETQKLTLRVAGSMRADSVWSANTTVGSILSAALGKYLDEDETIPAFPPKDEVTAVADEVTTVTTPTNVTYHFPFPQPKPNDGETYDAANPYLGTPVPYLLTLPQTSCGNELKTVIFVHGITSNRTASLQYATAMAQNCVATIAIDLPEHGVVPTDGPLALFSMDTENAEQTRSPWAGVAAAGGKTIKERHGNVYQDASTNVRQMMVYSANAADRKGTSGSTFINLQNFARTNDLLRQAVADLLNLGASLKHIDSRLDTNNVYVVGHSLGGIVAAAYVATNNHYGVQLYSQGALPQIKGLIMAGSGANLTKLLENSPAFAPTIVAGLDKSNVKQGSESFEKFLGVFQSLLDGVDPANTLGSPGIKGYAAAGAVATPVKALAVAGDNTVPFADYFAKEGSDNIFGQYVNPYCFKKTPACNPNNSGEAGIALPNAYVPTAKAPLAGTQGLAVVSGQAISPIVPSSTSVGHRSFASPVDADDSAFAELLSASADMMNLD